MTSHILALGDPSKRRRYDASLAERLNQEMEGRERKPGKSVFPNPEAVDLISQEPIIPSYNLSDFIIIPETRVAISKREMFRGKHWRGTHYNLLKNGFTMPRIDQFMKHYVNVRDVVVKSVGVLRDATGTRVELDEAKALWAYLSSNSLGDGCHTYLDAQFDIDETDPYNSPFYLFTDHKLNPKMRRSLMGRKVELEDYLGKGKTHTEELSKQGYEGKFVDLDFNMQGMPKRISVLGKYSPGENIYYCGPRAKGVASFEIHSDGTPTLDLAGNSIVKLGENWGSFACIDLDNPQGRGTS